MSNSASSGGLLALIPRGARLDEAEFSRRHRVLMTFLLAHVPVVLAIGAINGHLGHPMSWVVLAAMVILGIAGAQGSQLWRATAVSLALMIACSAVLHVGNGSTHLHIWFYVVAVAISLYQMWIPFLAAVVYVALHHIGMSLLMAGSVFSDRPALAYPLPYALLHAFFLLAEAGWLAYTWRIAEKLQRSREDELERSRQALQEKADAEEALAAERAAAAQSLADRLAAQEMTATRISSSIDFLHGVGGRLDDDASEAHEMLETLRQTIDNIGNRSRQASETAQQAEAGSTHISAVIGRLRDTLGQIDELASSIDSVASQTNLLALNATIESARAGEAGKGFAVVAGEVKELASETKDATDRIRRVIDAVRAEVTEASEAAGGIHDVITAVVDAQTTIAMAVEQQNAAAVEGLTAIGRINQEASSLHSHLTDLVTQTSATR